MRRISRLVLPMLVVMVLLVGKSASPSRAATPLGLEQPTCSSPTSPSCAAQFYGVSCTSKTFCVAVGSVGNEIDTDGTTVVETFRGSTWARTKSPNGTLSYSQLLSVSCTSPKWCMAVGLSFNAADTAWRTLTERWDGSAWSVVPSPNNSLGFSNLESVSCPTDNWCVAVGYAQSQTADPVIPLVDTYSDGKWSAVKSATPPSGTPAASVDAVSCTSSSFCVGVGQAWNYSETKTVALFETDQDGRWSLAPSASALATRFGPLAVSCRSDTFCEAVGGTAKDTMAESFDGTRWSASPPPSPSGSGSSLYGVSCTSSRLCESAGYSTPSSGSPANATLTERLWAGKWSILPSPNEGSQGNELVAISCVSADFCVAVGGYIIVAGGFTPSSLLVEKFGGLRWRLVSVPSPA